MKTMKHQIFSTALVEEAARKMKVANLQEATIGEVLLVASHLEKETGIPFIRMDQGSPGLPANRIGIEAEKAALDRGVGATYPAAAGVQELKEAASRFVKAFINTDISPAPAYRQLGRSPRLSPPSSPVLNATRRKIPFYL